MKRQKIELLFALTSAMLSGASVFAQGQPNLIRGSVSLEGKYVMLPPGTTFEGRIDQTIGSSISHAGQSFVITMSAPVLLNGADVVIPAGSQVVGEVVEAVPSSKIAHHKDEPVPDGILRVQLTGLKTAEGATFPLVASFTYDHDKGSGVAYVGTPESFVVQNNRGGNTPNGQPLDTYASRHTTDRTRAQAVPWQNMGNAYSSDGNGYPGNGYYQSGNNANKHRQKGSGIESLVRRNHNLFIDGGSPLTMKLNAPLKIGFNPAVSPVGTGAGNMTSAPVIPQSSSQSSTTPVPTQSIPISPVEDGRF